MSATSSDFLDHVEFTVHVGTAVISVATSILLGMWLPKLPDSNVFTQSSQRKVVTWANFVGIMRCSLFQLFAYFSEMRLSSFCNDIEIHRKGYMKIVMEDI